MTEPSLQLGEPADEADWRALVEQGLKGAQWQSLVARTSDGIPIEPLYREPDMHTASDVSGMPGAAPFVRGARQGGWLIRQSFAHPDAERTNNEILADLGGGVGAIELVIDPEGASGVKLREASDLDRALAGVILEAAPVSLDAGEHGAWFAGHLRDKLKGVAAKGTAFNLDPLGAFMRNGKLCLDEHALALQFTARHAHELPAARFMRVDARIVHEAGGTEAQEIGAALACGAHYLRTLTDSGLELDTAARALSFAVAVGPDVLVEAAKLRAMRLCWARMLEASGLAADSRAAHVHAFNSRRMMTRYDAWTNILRVTTAAVAAAVGGADEITTYPLTEALGLPTAFARRVARNTQHVLLEECRLGHVADPAGGAWFVERLTRELAAKAWSVMQEIETKGGIVEALNAGFVQAQVAEARTARQRVIATRRETITGVSDYPLLGAAMPEFERLSSPVYGGGVAGGDRGGGALRPLSHAARDSSPAGGGANLAFTPIRWAAPFEALRDRAEALKPRPSVFFATLGRLSDFGPRAQFARNLFAAGGVGALGEEEEYQSRDAMIYAFRSTRARVAVIVGADATTKDEAENAAQRLKAAGAAWVVLAGRPGEAEARLRAAGIDQFAHAGQDALQELQTLHAALGIAS